MFCSATVTVPWKDESRLPELLSAWTVRPKPAPAVIMAGGCCVTTNWSLLRESTPIALVPQSVNQRLPLGPVVISSRPEPVEGMGYSVMAKVVGLISPIIPAPPLPPSKYTYTIKAIIPGPNGPGTVTSRIDIRPDDFESIDLREPGKLPITDVEYEPTPQKVVVALLRLARLTSKDVVWDLGCGDGRISVTAAKQYACKARGFDLDPERVKDSLANVRKHGVERLVTIEQRDIFTLDLSKGPTIVTLYLLPRLDAKLLPQLRKLPPGARVISVAHRMADVKPDEQIVVDTELGEFDVYLWKAETLRVR